MSVDSKCEKCLQGCCPTHQPSSEFTAYRKLEDKLKDHRYWKWQPGSSYSDPYKKDPVEEELLRDMEKLWFDLDEDEQEVITNSKQAI